MWNSNNVGNLVKASTSFDFGGLRGMNIRPDLQVWNEPTNEPDTTVRRSGGPQRYDPIHQSAPIGTHPVTPVYNPPSTVQKAQPSHPGPSDPWAGKPDPTSEQLKNWINQSRHSGTNPDDRPAQSKPGDSGWGLDWRDVLNGAGRAIQHPIDTITGNTSLKDATGLEPGNSTESSAERAARQERNRQTMRDNMGARNDPIGNFGDPSKWDFGVGGKTIGDATADTANTLLGAIVKNLFGNVELDLAIAAAAVIAVVLLIKV